MLKQLSAVLPLEDESPDFIEDTSEGVEKNNPTITVEDALSRIEAISELPKLAKYARTLHKHGLIHVEKGVPYYQEGAMIPIEGVDGSQTIIDDLLARKRYLTDSAPHSKPDVPKLVPAPKVIITPLKRTEAQLQRDLIDKAVRSLPATKNPKELEIRAYALHQAGVIIKINTRDGYAVRVVEGIEDSQELVDLINLKKKEFQVNALIKQVEKATDRESIIRLLRQSIVRSFINKDETPNPDIPSTSDLSKAIHEKLRVVKKERPLTSTIAEALRKF